MCPPGVDQTMRTPQKWQLIAPDIKQSDSLSKDKELWSSRIFEAVFNPSAKFDAWSKFARPVIPSRPTKIAPWPSAKAIKPERHTEHSGVSTLPFELVLMILESEDISKTDIISLAMACPGLLPIIITYIQSCYMKTAAAWAGTPVAVLGNYTLDLPASFMESEEVKKKQANWNVVRSRFPMTIHSGTAPTRRYFWSCAEYGKPNTLQLEERRWKDTLKELANQNHHYSSTVVKHIGRQLICPDLFPRNKEWVLRNLTAKEFYIPQAFPAAKKKSFTIRSGFFSRITEKTEVVQPRTLGFDDVLLLRTCWTSIFEQNELRGKWAGHCFDIVTTEVFDAEGRKGWVDVSKELLMEAMQHWDDLSQ